MPEKFEESLVSCRMLREEFKQYEVMPFFGGLSTSVGVLLLFVLVFL